MNVKPLNERAKDQVLGALRKRNQFVFNPLSRSQRGKFHIVLRNLKRDEVVTVRKAKKDRWLYERGRNWPHQSEVQRP